MNLRGFKMFLRDINPLAKGHTLVVPKKEIDYIFDVEDALYKELFGFAKKVGLAIESVISCKRIGMIVFGLDVQNDVFFLQLNHALDYFLRRYLTGRMPI